MTERLQFYFSLSLSCIGEGNGNPLQCYCVENPRDRGAWWAAIYGVAQRWTRLKRLSSSSNSRVHHEKRWAGRSTSWNQDCWEKYQSPQICRWHQAESEEELKILLMKVKVESEIFGLKLDIQETKIMASGPIT